MLFLLEIKWSLFLMIPIINTNTCSNVKKDYTNSSTSRTCEKSTRFQIKMDPPSIANISDLLAIASSTFTYTELS